jgi:hypothetical protein
VASERPAFLVGRPIPTKALLLLALAAPAPGTQMALSGCGAGASSVRMTARTIGGQFPGPASSGRAVGTAHAGGLTVRLVVTPSLAKRGSAVRIEVIAHEQHAGGAFGYRLRYGDGTASGSGAVPQFCLSPGSGPAHDVWRLTHRYRAKGRHVVSVSVHVNCTKDRATATTPVRVD